MANIIALILCVPILYFLPKVTLLHELGVDETAPYMAVLFGISYFFISQFMVKPYRANLDFRKKNTGGSLEAATALGAESEKLALEYQSKLKVQNETTQSVYEKIKSEGLIEEEKIITAARAHGSDLVNKTKSKISTELASARDTLKAQIPQLSELIASRVLGRDIK